MKKLLLLPIFASLLSSWLYTGGFDLDLHHIFGRCSGSNAYCSACSNCSSCKNCSVYGGSCAVCYTPKVSRSKRVAVPRSAGSSGRSSYNRSHSYHRVLHSPPTSPVLNSQTIGIPKQLPEQSQTLNREAGSKIATKDIAEPQDNFLAPQPKSNGSFTISIPDDAEIIMVITPKANLRQSATTKSEIVEEVLYGTLLMKLGETGDWVKVQTIDSGSVGFVFSEVVQ